MSKKEGWEGNVQKGGGQKEGQNKAILYIHEHRFFWLLLANFLFNFKILTNRYAGDGQLSLIHTHYTSTAIVKF